MTASSQIANREQLDLQELAADLVSRARKAGATAAEAIVGEGTEFSSAVRLGHVETLKQAGSRGLGLRVFLGQRSASAYTSDFTPEGINRLIQGAIDLARLTSEDACAGLPRPDQLGSVAGDLQLYSSDLVELLPEQRIEFARRAERAALDFDSRIGNSEGGSFDASTGRKVLANSLGFVGESQRSYCSVLAAPIAQTDGSSSTPKQMQKGYWFSAARSAAKLESPESVGQEAARRALRRLGARKVASTRVPVVLEPRVAASILGNILDAVNGNAIYRQSSFLAGRLGETVAAEKVNIVDDGTIPGGFGTSPFDGEGVPTRRTMVIEGGLLQAYLLNCYAARKLGLETTANASRGLTGNPGIGSGNFFLQPGAKTPAEIISEVKRGLYITDFLGFGVNPVTGDFSRGASGLWIENGELAFPVEEITVAGNLKEMLLNIAEIGNDLVFRSAIACPTLRIEGMMIAGE